MRTLKMVSSLACFILILFCFSACGDSSGNALAPVTLTQSRVSESVSETQQESKTESVVTEPQTGAAERADGGVDAAWFDDAVFVGDSVTLKLSYYCESHPEALSDAQFFCAGSLGYNNALWALDAPDSVHPYYQGQNYQTQDCAKVTGATKVLVMLGMNDIGLYGVDGAMNAAKTLVSDILAQTPGVTIYMQSVTPIINGKERGSLTNANIRAFNEQLRQYCAESGYTYLDIYSLLCDEDGYLKSEYCGDPDAQGIHFTDAACAMWADYLKENV